MGEQLISGEIPSRLTGMERGSKQIPDTSFGWMRLLTRHSGVIGTERAASTDLSLPPIWVEMFAYLISARRAVAVEPTCPGGLRVDTYARFRTCLTVPPCFSIFCWRSMMA